MYATMESQPKLALLPIPDELGGTGKLPPRSDMKERYLQETSVQNGTPQVHHVLTSKIVLPSPQVRSMDV